LERYVTREVYRALMTDLHGHADASRLDRQ
jgi:hypothetical protein